jgi:hypothetical protein
VHFPVALATGAGAGVGVGAGAGAGAGAGVGVGAASRGGRGGRGDRVRAEAGAAAGVSRVGAVAALPVGVLLLFKSGPAEVVDSAVLPPPQAESVAVRVARHKIRR